MADENKELNVDDLEKVSGGGEFSGSGIPVQQKCPRCGGDMEYIPYIHECICVNCG